MGSDGLDYREWTRNTSLLEVLVIYRIKYFGNNDTNGGNNVSWNKGNRILYRLCDTH